MLVLPPRTADTAPAGPALPPNTPLNILTPSSTYVRTDNASNFAYPSSGNGSTAPEQYLAYHPNTSDASLIQPGQTALLQNEQTGQWCRLAPLPSNATQLGMLCDQPTQATATPFTYTGDGLAYGGVALVSPGPGQPLLLANTTSTPVVGPTADNLSLLPVSTPSGECKAEHMHRPGSRDARRLGFTPAQAPAPASLAGLSSCAHASGSFCLHCPCGTS